MKTAIAQNDIVLCRQETDEYKTTESGFVFPTNELPTYSVVALGPKANSCGLSLSVGDIIIANSKGSIVDVDGERLHVFKAENISGKVEDTYEKNSN